MIKWIKSFFIKEETNSLCPDSFAVMPNNKFHNYAIVQRKHDDDEEPHKNIWEVFDFNKQNIKRGLFDIKKYDEDFRKNIFYSMYGK